ncbi:transposase [Leisingera sp. F5]|uniref:IS110 family transposase n=1 Tax=Leisingera sp. F5 TaxID=1813816 RepID=UPI0025BDC1DF|nr:transposase [Leisingera sp. F5]
MVKKATRISRFVAAVEDRPAYVGLDVHEKTYSVALFEPVDGVVETDTCPSGEEALAEQLTGLRCQIAHVVYESGPTGLALARALERAGLAVSVIAASRIPRGYSAAAKSDQLDAVRLANYFARGLLRPIAIPAIEQEGYRALVRRRKRIAESRGKIKQKIKGFLLASGIEEPASLQKWSLAASATCRRCRSRRNTVWRYGARVSVPACRGQTAEGRDQGCNHADAPGPVQAPDAGHRSGGDGGCAFSG